MAKLFLPQAVAFFLVLVCSVSRADQPIVFDQPANQASSPITFVDRVTNRNNFPATLPVLRTNNTPVCANSPDNPDAPCEDDADYNKNVEAYINLLLSSSKMNSIYGDPSVKPLLQDDILVGPATTRFGGGGLDEETPVCQSRETLIFPKRAKNPQDEWVFVVNQGDVQQAIKVEKCINEGQTCGFGGPPIPDVQTFCRQKYVYKRMLTVGSNRIEPEQVLMPSCCVCYIRRSFDIASRVRNRTSTPATPGANSNLSPVPPHLVPTNQPNNFNQQGPVTYNVNSPVTHNFPSPVTHNFPTNQPNHNVFSGQPVPTNPNFFPNAQGFPTNQPGPINPNARQPARQHGTLFLALPGRQNGGHLHLSGRQRPGN